MAHIDSSRFKSQSIQHIEQTIGKIPDLYAPSSYRWAGERDLFMETKKIDLKPFRKQRVFETCISPKLRASHSIETDFQPIRKAFEFKCASEFSVNQEEIFKPQQYKKKNKVTFVDDGIHTSKERTRSFSKMSNIERFGCNTKLSKFDNEEKRIKLQLHRNLNKKYSKLHLKRKPKIDNHNYRAGFDKLFCSKPDSSYPFVNPMPDCMLTEDHVGNLREIIVSSLDIEWRMLTPLRPKDQYSEKYFDKLICLHRNRYKTRIEMGYYNSKLDTPFKHSRHTYLIKYPNSTKSKPHDPHRFQTLIDQSKLARRIRRGSRRLRSDDQNITKLNIPTLTLTSDDKSGQLLIEEKLDGDTDNEANEEFTYESFSRFSKKSRLGLKKLEKYLELNNKSCQEIDQIEIPQSDEVLDDKVEDIMRRLISTSIA